jgi:hypothetical protein
MRVAYLFRKEKYFSYPSEEGARSVSALIEFMSLEGPGGISAHRFREIISVSASKNRIANIDAGSPSPSPALPLYAFTLHVLAY